MTSIVTSRNAPSGVGCMAMATVVSRPSAPRESEMSMSHMNRRHFLSTISLAGLGLIAKTANSAEPAVWKAGLAKAAITPEQSVWLAGYGSKRAPDGKLHELWMKALALRDLDGRTAVLITSDFQGVPRSMSDRVFSQLKEKHGLERSQVMFTFSHNHCGPRLGDDLLDYYPVDPEQEQLVAAYTDQMVTRTVELVTAALANLAPATLAQGQGRADLRREPSQQSRARRGCTAGCGTPLVGPVDHSVRY